jgi:RNA polymerase sigma-70 factor (ECF subfamily)
MLDRLEKKTEPDDDEIIRRILHGETNAFEYLVERYRDEVFRIVTRHVPAEDVESVAQDAFVRTYLSLGTYGRKSDFKHWLTRIALRTSYDYWREKYRSRETPLASLGEDESQWLEHLSADEAGRKSLDEAASREARELLARAMDLLSPEDRLVLELVHIEERPVKEAAEILGWSVANVKVRAFRSRRKLRSILEKMLNKRLGRKA